MTSPSAPMDIDKPLHNLWINAELFQHKVDKSHAVDMRIPEQQKAKAEVAIKAEFTRLLEALKKHQKQFPTGLNEVEAFVSVRVIDSLIRSLLNER